MAAGAFADITNSIKNVYVDKVVEPMVNNEAPFREFLSKELPAGAKVREGLVTFLANTLSNQALGQMADQGALPPTVDRTDVQLVLKPTIFAGAVEVGFMSMSAVDSNKSAWNGGEFRRQTNDIIANAAKFIESTYTSTHGTGRRARVESDGASSTFVAALPEGTRLLRENHYISVRTTDGGASVRDSTDGRRITKIDHATRTVTYSGADQTLVAGDHVHVVTETTQTLTNVFANGLRGLIDDGTFLTSPHGASRTTNPKLKANIFSNGGTLRNLTEQLLLRSAHEIQARSGKRITHIWTSEGQIEKYVEFVAPDKRLVVTSKADTGSKATGYREGDLVFYAPGIACELKRSFDIVPRELYMLNVDTLFHYEAKKFGWATPEQMLWLSPATAAYKASLLGYMCSVENIGCDWFEANGKIADLKDPAVGDA